VWLSGIGQYDCLEVNFDMSRAIEKYVRKQNKILEAARTLFLRGGYRQTSMDSVAEEAEVTKQTVYRYFPSKKDLFDEVLRFNAPKNDEYIFGDGDVISELMEFSGELLRLLLTEERLGLYRLVIVESVSDSKLGEALNDLSQSRRRERLSDYISSKLFADNAEKDAELLISMLLSLRNKVLTGGSAMPDEVEIAEHCFYVVSLFINGRRAV